MSTIADKLQDLVAAKEDMKTALIEKGVTPTGGLSTYADAVREIENEVITIEGGGVDYTEIGWSTTDNATQNIIDNTIIVDDIAISKYIMEYFKDGFDVTDAVWTNNRHKIAYMPVVNVSNTYSMHSMFGAYAYQNTGRPILKVFPPLSTKYVKDMEYMFAHCSSLESVGLLDCSSVTTINGMFMYNNNLRHLGGFLNLGSSINTFSSLADGTLDFRESPSLTKESVLNVFNTIGKKGPKAAQLTIYLSSDMLSLLTSDDISIATTKGWTIKS